MADFGYIFVEHSASLKEIYFICLLQVCPQSENIAYWAVV
jgi:hypothetical protein